MTGKRILATLASTLLVLAGALLLYLNLADFNRYKPLIAEQVRNATGRNLVMAGPLELQVFFDPRLTIEDVRLANMPGGTREDMLRIGRIEAAVRLIPLLSGKLAIERLVVHQADLLLETDAKGRGNWEFGAARTEGAAEGTRPLPAIHDLQFHDATLVYHNGVRATRETLHVDSLEVAFPGYTHPLRFRLSGTANEAGLRLGGEIDSLATLLAGDTTRVQLEVDEQVVAGKLELQLAGTRPALRADLGFEALVFGSRPATGTSRGGKVFPTGKFDASALRTLDADLRLQGDRLAVAGMAFREPRIVAKLDRGRLSLESLRFRSGGELTASGTFAAGDNGGKLQLRVRGADLDIGAMLAAPGTAQPVTDGLVRIQADFHGTGDSVAALMGNLDGTLVVEAGPGTIDNAYLDLAGEDLVSRLINALDPRARQEKTTQLRCAVASLQFRDGIAEYDRRIAIETGRMNIVSSGVIDLRSETLDIGFAPRPRKDAPGIGVGAGDLVGIARLRGPLASPELGVDAMGAAKAGLKAYSAVATAGVSLVIGGLVEKHLADPHPCQTARTGVVAGDGPASKLEETVDSTVDKVKSGLKKLFDF